MELKPINLAGLKTVFADQPVADLLPTVNAGRVTTKIERQRFTTARNVRRATEDIGQLPQPGEAVHFRHEPNSWALFDALPSIINTVGRPADEVILASLGINSRHLQSLGELFEQRQIKHCSLLLSHFFSRVDKGEFSEAVELFRRWNFPIREARSHAKLILIRFGTDRHIVLTSSGNLRSCRSVEVSILLDDQELFHFHRHWIHKMLGATA